MSPWRRGASRVRAPLYKGKALRPSHLSSAVNSSSVSTKNHATRSHPNAVVKDGFPRRSVTARPLHRAYLQESPEERDEHHKAHELGEQQQRSEKRPHGPQSNVEAERKRHRLTTSYHLHTHALLQSLQVENCYYSVWVSSFSQQHYVYRYFFSLSKT